MPADNIFLYLIGGVLILFIISTVWTFTEEKKDGRRELLRKWLEYAVTVAEAELGEKTGQLKLRFVYDMALRRFGWLEKVVTFSEFSAYVDEALEWMRAQIQNNAAVREVIANGNNSTN